MQKQWFLVLLILCFFRQGQVAFAQERDPNTLILAIDMTPVDYDPASNNDYNGNMVMSAVNEALVRVNPQNINEFVPELATHWEVNEDFTLWTFHLREGVQFHDGTAFNADAVKFSFSRLVNIQLGMSFLLNGFLSNPEEQIVIVDDYTVEFHLLSPSPLFINALASSYGAYIISPTSVMANEVDGDMGHAWLESNEAGTGPYTIVENLANDRIVLDKFDGWWGWEAYPNAFERVIVQIVPEAASRRALIETGAVDIAAGISPYDVPALMENPDIHVDMDEGLAVRYIAFGDYGPLADPRVRQAISYAFDYESYIQGAWSGLAQRPTGVMPSQLQCHDENAFTYQTDLNRARELLAEAGVSNLELKIMVQDLNEPAAIILQAQLAQIGVSLNIEQRDPVTYTTLLYSNEPVYPDRPDMMIWDWWPDYNNPAVWSWVIYHTDAWGSSGANIGFYSNERVDEIIYTADPLAPDYCEQFAELQNILTEQDPVWIPLVETPNQIAMRRDIQGYLQNPLYRGTYEFHQLSRNSGNE